MSSFACQTGAGSLCLGVAAKPVAQKQMAKYPAHEFFTSTGISRNESRCPRGKEGVPGGNSQT